MFELFLSFMWFSRWFLEGLFLFLSNFDGSIFGVNELYLVMCVYVFFLLLINSLWLFYNVYWFWVLDREVLVDMKVVRLKIIL